MTDNSEQGTRKRINETILNDLKPEPVGLEPTLAFSPNFNLGLGARYKITINILSFNVKLQLNYNLKLQFRTQNFLRN
ncbi:hypothetical protein B4U84_14360 [Westiellopsis prolifica IICB1]|nr:hypothetical protein B4U84_14360 [Westiellopsis prolifica IICB1]